MVSLVGAIFGWIYTPLKMQEWPLFKGGHFEGKGLSSNHYCAGDTVDGRNPIQPPGIFKIRDKEWDKLPTTTGDRRISEPSTAC